MRAWTRRFRWLLDCGGCCGASGAGRCGCAPKLDLLARAPDAPRIAHLLQERWRALALQEGTADDDHPALAATTAPEEAAEPPCPACGTAAPLVDNACSDCGLQLA